MATIITPSLGHAVFTQTGVGTTPGYDCVDLRRGFDAPDTGEGVETYGTYRVSQRGAGANMSVDVAQDAFAYIRGDAVTHQGYYRVHPHSATINEAIATADATNPRIDQVVLRVFDTTHDASGSNNAQVQVLAGTPTGGATLDNRTGTAAMPSSAILLADVLVAAADTSISDAEIRDRRSFCAPETVPPLLTDVDMVALEPLFRPLTPASAGLAGGSHDLNQAAVLMYLRRRIVGATRIRWRYLQNGATALTGNYVIGIYDASGRKIVDTGSVAFTGAVGTVQVRSETISATTFEPGAFYVFIGLDATNSGICYFAGMVLDIASNVALPTVMPNEAVRSSTGGITAPSTILGFTDINGITSAQASPSVPLIALSVG